jgi:hypothetical protein
MPTVYPEEKLKLWTPATYRIEVNGIIDESWTDNLAGMCISQHKRADQSTVTTLTGRLKDQAMLSGVLNGLYDLHLPIISVQILTPDNGDPQDSDTLSASNSKREDSRH